MSGHFYLNGNWRIQLESVYPVAGSKVYYERRKEGVGLSEPETIRCLGPINEPLYLVVSHAIQLSPIIAII